VTRVEDSADLSIVKRGPKKVAPGATVRYTLIVSNAGPDAARDLVVVDDLPDGVTLISASGAGWSCDNKGNRSVRCERPRLASGADAPPITLVVRTPNSADDITNQASVRASTFDPTSANNSGTAATVVATPGGGGNGGDDPGPGTDGGTMPDTGAGSTQGMLALALSLMVVGGVLWAFGRRRRS
jgi:large repetitive protein